MHFHFLDQYHARSSPLHRLDARVKLAWTLSIILACSLQPDGAWPALILLAAGLISMEMLTFLPVGYYWRRSLLALPFVLAAIPLLFSMPGNEVTIGGLSISAAGLVRFGTIAVKAILSVQTALILATTTSQADLLAALRWLHLPGILVTVTGLMVRYLGVIGDEAGRLVRARFARSGVPAGYAGKTGGTLPWRAKVTGGMVGNLLLRSIDRSDRVYNAMLARGYNGEIRQLDGRKLTSGEWILAAAGLLVCAGIVILGRL